MPGAVRVGVDVAGGLELGHQSTTVFVDGVNVTVLNDKVKGHGPGAHSNPTMNEASSTVFADGIAICRQGDTATCGHTASGSSDVIVG